MLHYIKALKLFSLYWNDMTLGIMNGLSYHFGSTLFFTETRTLKPNIHIFHIYGIVNNTWQNTDHLLSYILHSLEQIKQKSLHISSLVQSL